MIKRDEDDAKVIRAIRTARLDERLLEMLRRRQAAYDKNLRTAGPEIVRIMQGRAQELDDLITLFSSKD